ncbi:CDP-archaeol synthase [Candidatus Woesearchaeota archaeon]|nr:CDP-archaeol synthase [Candidatus Woesearchaeota archaeon]
MLQLFVNTFWLFLPAGIANMTPVLVKFIPFFNYPLDFNKKYKNKRIFGKNKTFRGLFFGIIMSMITAYFLGYLMSIPNLLFYGFLMGFGAIMGDAIESFFKRQKNISPGKSFVPFDQIDWIIGSFLMVKLFYNISWIYLLTSLILFGLLHPLINLLGYVLKIKKNKF